MNLVPPIRRRPPSRALGAGRWSLAAMALGVALAVAGCGTPPVEGPAGLMIAAVGPITVTDADGRPEQIDGSPADVRFVTASSGRIAASTPDGRVFVSGVPGAGEARAWRAVALDEPAGRALTGIDLSPDGRVLAVVLGDPDSSGLELVTVDVETGATEVRASGLSSNGPPAWIGEGLIALEVIRPDQHSGIATVDIASGEVTVTDALGFAPAPAADGSRVAYADPASGRVTISDVANWRAGDPADDPGIAALPESSPQDVAIDADGTRLAVAYAANSGASSTVVIFRLTDKRWEKASSIPVDGDAAVSIDWLD